MYAIRSKRTHRFFAGVDGFLKLVFAFCGEEAAVSSFIAACVHFRMAV